jgi:hypothetical protein
MMIALPPRDVAAVGISDGDEEEPLLAFPTDSFFSVGNGN